LFAAASWGASISVVPAASSVNVGDYFAVSVVVDSATPIYAWEVTLTYSGGLVNGGTVTEGPFLATGGGTTFVALGPDDGLGQFGPVGATLNGAGPGVSGAGTLATFTFQALASGVAQFGVTSVTLLDETLFDITASSTPAQVTVNDESTVPEPTTIVLVGLSLATIGSWRYALRKNPVSDS
jgi:hypothetical protein